MPPERISWNKLQDFVALQDKGINVLMNAERNGLITKSQGETFLPAIFTGIQEFTA